MESLLVLFQQQHEKGKANRRLQMEHLLESVSDHYRQPKARQAKGFNLFDVFGFGSDEEKHSSILAWLLDENAGHGQGNSFLKAFCRQAGIKLSGDALKEYSVRVEYTGRESRIDILIYRKSEFMIYIENKIFAGEQPNQVDREWRDLNSLAASLWVQPNNRHAVFLTLEGCKPSSGNPDHWACMSHTDLALAFNALKGQIDNPKVGFLLEDLEITVNNWRGYESIFTGE